MANANELYRAEIEHGEYLVTQLKLPLPKGEKEALLREVRRIERECGVTLYGKYNG